jgi:predicted RNA-binding protein associated with RNAse of E/G family
VGFEPGREVLYRNIDGERLACVRPCRVISDDERGLLLWLARGSAVIVEKAVDGRHIREMPFAEWVTLEHEPVQAMWQGPGLLKFIPPEGDHSVWFFRDRDDRFQWWYVNLEYRALRWDDGDAAGVDVIDQDLDIVVHPDRTWEFKDEDEFAERLTIPSHYWVRDEATVWAEARRVIKLIEAGAFPFDGTWTGFEPDPAWPVSREIPKGWDRPPVERENYGVLPFSTHAE